MPQKDSGFFKSTILVIDDDIKIKQSLELAFPEYEFISAPNGEQGLKIMDQPNDVDAVVLDVKMGAGQIDGIGVLQQLKTRHPRTPVIMMTGFGRKETVVQALQGHADDFVDKPFDIDDMRSKLERLLETAQSEASASGQGPGAVDKVVRLLQKNSEKRVSLAAAASFVSLSPKYLSRVIKEETQKNFTEWRLGIKMQYARKLLKETSMNVEQISEKIGYDNAESFMKMFKKMYGQTPTEYRGGR